MNHMTDFKNVTPDDDSDMENLIAVVGIIFIFVIGVLV